LDETKTTLICGKNGVGKSQVMDAITFALFNKPFRKINKPQLVNSINNKNCLVEIEFKIGRIKYVVCRGMKPNIFEIYKNGKLLNQSADNRDYQEILEKRIIGMNYKTFCQIVILGSANWTAFMSLSAQARRNVIEDLLDIEVFSIMNVLLKNKNSENKRKLQDLNTRITILDNTIKLNTEYRQSLKKNQQKEIDLKQKQIEAQNKQIKEHEIKIDILQKEIDELTVKLKEVTKTREQIQKHKNKILQINQIKTKIQKDINFYKKNDNCPTCKQEIPETFKSQIIGKNVKKENLTQEISQKLESILKKLEQYIKEYSDISEKIATKNKELQNHLVSITVSNHVTQNLLKEIKKLDNKQDKFSTDIKNEKKERSQKLKEKEKCINEREIYNVANMLLKDNGIKTQIIKQYIPIMNTLINKYLERMEFFCQFLLDENFNEKIKYRHKDIFSYDSFSQGEKMRIDLALLLTWREISKMRNASPINLLLLDEIMDSSLDSAGTEEFIRIISELTGDNNVIIISHKVDQIGDKFGRMIVVTKKKNYSQFKEV